MQRKNNSKEKGPINELDRKLSELRGKDESKIIEIKRNAFMDNLDDYIGSGMGTYAEKLQDFCKYVPRQNLTKFFAKYELFKKVLDVEGSIVECGVRFGGGLMAFAQMSSIFEPVNYTRKIIGFDTFSGFPNLSNKDEGSISKFAHKGGLATDSYNDLLKSISLYDSNRFINHIHKVELVKGDATVTIPKYLKNNPHTVVSLLFLDFDIYEPTKTALEYFLPRMPKGSIIAFDELNYKDFVGETRAVLDTIGIRNLEIKRFSFNSFLSYAVLDGGDLQKNQRRR